MAHHVQKKATKHHEHSRPRKSRPSDINRTPPQYPPIPDTPWMTPTQSLKVTESKVSIQISPSDTAADLNTKLQAAGAGAVERFVYKGVELTSTLAECGLRAGSSLATTEMRIAMIRIVDATTKLTITVMPTLFVDDLSAEMMGEEERNRREKTTREW